MQARELRAADALRLSPARAVKRVTLMPDEVVVKQVLLSPCPSQAAEWFEGPCDCMPAYLPRPLLEPNLTKQLTRELRQLNLKYDLVIKIQK